MLTIINYGVGNLFSIKNMFSKIGYQAIVTSDIKVIEQAEKTILPGVGNFDYCMESFRNTGFFDIVEKKVLGDKIPLLGICAGFQMLFNKSEEGKEKGLGWIDDEIVRFKLPADSNLKIPHMGWTDINVKNDDILFKGIDEPRFYFVHSYHLPFSNHTYITSTANYGYEFASSVRKENIFGVQFHPEKSHKYGMKIFENFSKIS